MNPSFEKFKKGVPLTRKQAMDAQCYECNGYSVMLKDDCLGVSCPLYQWSPWQRHKKAKKKGLPNGLKAYQKKKSMVG